MRPIYESAKDREAEAAFLRRLARYFGRRVEGTPTLSPIDFRMYLGDDLCAVGECKQSPRYGFAAFASRGEGYRLHASKIDVGVPYGDEQGVPFLLCVCFRGDDYFAMISAQQMAGYAVVRDWGHAVARDAYDWKPAYDIPYSEFSRLEYD